MRQGKSVHETGDCAARPSDVTTLVKNLLNLDHVPASKHVFYYGPQVEALNDDALIAEDLVLYVERPIDPAEYVDIYRGKTDYTREDTVTAAARKKKAAKPRQGSHPRHLEYAV